MLCWKHICYVAHISVMLDLSNNIFIYLPTRRVSLKNKRERDETLEPGDSFLVLLVLGNIVFNTHASLE